jgi:hypothetical protein
MRWVFVSVSPLGIFLGSYSMKIEPLYVLGLSNCLRVLGVCVGFVGFFIRGIIIGVFSLNLISGDFIRGLLISYLG